MKTKLKVEYTQMNAILIIFFSILGEDSQNKPVIQIIVQQAMNSSQKNYHKKHLDCIGQHPIY